MQATISQHTGDSHPAAGGTNPISSISQLGHFFKHDAFPWVMAGFYLLSTDYCNQHTLMKEFTTAQAPKNHFSDFSVRVKGMLNDRKIPYKHWVKRIQKHKKLKDQIQEVFSVLPDVCKKFVEILKDSFLLCPDRTNIPLNQLLRLTYECVQRLFVRYRTRPSPGNTDYTIFGHNLRDVGQCREFDDLIERIKKQGKDAEGMDRLVDLCTQLLEMVRSQNTDKMNSCDQNFQEMEDIIKNMNEEAKRFKNARAFKDGSRRSVMLVTGMQRSADARGDTDLASLFDSAAPTPRGAPCPLSESRQQAVAADPGTPIPLSDSPHDRNMLEVLVGQLKGRTEKYEVHEPRARNMEYTTYASDVVCELRRNACRVMVLLRRMDPLSGSPDDMEVEILKRINKEAGLSKCIVVWATAPTDHVFSEEDYSEWKKPAPELNLSLVVVASPTDLSTFFHELNVAVDDSSELVTTAVDRKRDQLQDLAKKLCRSCSAFQGKRAAVARKSAGEFLMDFAEKDIKVLCETLLDELPETLTKEGWIDSNAEFQIPSAEYLHDNPDFRHVACFKFSSHAAPGDQTASSSSVPDDEHARDIQELQCRNQLLLMMLGQTVKKAANLAERAYDEVILKILDKVAECFSWTGRRCSWRSRTSASRTWQ